MYEGRKIHMYDPYGIHILPLVRRQFKYGEINSHTEQQTNDGHSSIFSSTIS